MSADKTAELANQLRQVYIYDVPANILAGLTRKSDRRHDQSPVEPPEDGGESASDEDSDTDQPQSRAGDYSYEPDQTEAAVKPAGASVDWHTSPKLNDLKVGPYNIMLPTAQSSLQSIQIDKAVGTTSDDAQPTERLMAVFMAGGGHFAGAMISIDGSSRQKCKLLQSKGFHRYTTRRKQGGAQSSNDNAKGAANSAGAQIRRQQEAMLKTEVAELIKEWRPLLDRAELVLVRASGVSSRKLLFDNGLSRTDPKVRRIPITTKRATQSEIVRCFRVLTMLQVASVDEPEDDAAQRAVAPQRKEPRVAAALVKEAPPDPKMVEHTSSLVASIRRKKASAVRQYLSEHGIEAAIFRLEPAKAYMHTPTLLHFAAVHGSAAVVTALLDVGARPQIQNASEKTAFEVADDREVKEAFRLWRGKSGNEERWNWDLARVPAALTAEQLQARRAREAEELQAEREAEAVRRRLELQKLDEEAATAREKERLAIERKRGPGRILQQHGIMSQTAASMAHNLEGVDPETRKKIERERRARAAEARFGKK